MTTFFISYNSADAVIAEEVATALEDAGQRVRFAGWEVRIGINIGVWMNEALEDCDRMVAIVSPDYLKPGAVYSEAERVAKLWHDIDGRKAAVIPLVVRPAEMPKLFGAISRYDLAKGTIDGFVAEVLRPPRPPKASTENGASASLTTPSAPKPKALFVNLPAGRTVVGRDEAAAELRAKLVATEDGTVAVTNSGAVLRGQGGLGKSTLARRYAEVYGGDYDGVIWVEALTRQGIIEGLVALCAHFDLAVPDTPQIQHAQAVLGKIAASGQSWLFIYDNVEAYADLKSLLPPKGAHLVVTTRQGEGWAGFEVMPLEKLGFETETSPAVRLLMDEAGRTEGAGDARALAEDLGGLPLALVVAGSLIKSTGEGLAAYRERLTEILAHAPDNEDYPTSVLGAVQLSYDQLSGDAKMIADLCAWWAAEGLEPVLLTEAPQGWRWDKQREGITECIQALAAESGRVRAAFAELTSRSLIDSGAGSWSMHRMTAAALRHLQAGRDDTETPKAAVVLVAALYPNDPNVSASWPLCARLTPHVRALWTSGAEPDTAALQFLLNQAALYLDKIADYSGGLDMIRASLAQKQKLLPEGHRDFALGLANLSIALMRAGNLKEAEMNAARAVALNKRYRPDSMELAESYDTQGLMFFVSAQERDVPAIQKALKRHQQALALKLKLVDNRKENISVSRSLNNVASIRSLQGRATAAARLNQSALTILRNARVPSDANIASCLLNTGASWLEAGLPSRAMPLLREGLEIRQTVFAAQPQHPETRSAADWLISCLLTLARGDDKPKARQTEARALCGQYGFDFSEAEELAKQFPLPPPEV